MHLYLSLFKLIEMRFVQVFQRIQEFTKCAPRGVEEELRKQSLVLVKLSNTPIGLIWLEINIGKPRVPQGLNLFTAATLVSRICFALL